MRRLALAASVVALLATGPASTWTWAATLGPLVQASGAMSPFNDCTADQTPGNTGTNFPNSEVEPWVDVNPTNPLNVVGSWQQDRWSNGGARGLLAGVSFDGGATWRQIVIPGITLCSDGRFERASDPWVTFAPNGDLYHMSLVFDNTVAPNRSGGFGPNGMAASKSTDGGLTWSAPVILAEDTDPSILHDKNTMTADPTDSRFVYAVWDRLQLPKGTVINPELVFGFGFKGPAVFTRTADGGESWEPIRVIYDPGANNQTIGNQIAVRPDGTLVDLFNEILNFKNSDGAAQFEFNVAVLHSFDKGATWTRMPVRIAKLLTVGVVDPDTGSPVRTGDIIPEIAVDPNGGNLYVVWQDGRFSGFQHDDIAFSVSTDGGFTWSAPRKVNRTPVAAAAFTPAVRVSADGTVGITYYDFRNNTPDPDTLPTDAFLVTLDRNGNPVGDEVRLTDESFDMRKAPVARGFFVGDYVGLGAAGNVFMPFFSVTTDTDPANVVFRTVTP